MASRIILPISPQIVGSVGKLVVNHLNFLAGTAHRERIEDKGQAKPRKLVPIYLDEFATFACPEFADLISKARSAGFALHFSHQSIGDLIEVSPAFLNRIATRAGTNSSPSLDAGADNQDFKTMVVRAVAAGLMQEFQSEASTAYNNAQVLTLKPMTEFFVELTDWVS